MAGVSLTSPTRTPISLNPNYPLFTERLSTKRRHGSDLDDADTLYSADGGDEIERRPTKKLRGLLW